METLQSWDEALMVTLNSWGIPSLDPIFLAISSTTVWIPLYLAVIILLYRKFDLARATLLVALCVIGVIFTDQGSVHLFKEMFQRPRPCYNEDLLPMIRQVKEFCGGQYGFISSHASNTFGFATLVGAIFARSIPWFRGVLILWACLVSYSRVYLGVHYPFDILGGAIFGALVGGSLARYARYRGWIQD